MLHATIQNGIGAASGKSGMTPDANVTPNTSQTKLTENELIPLYKSKSGSLRTHNCRLHQAFYEN